VTLGAGDVALLAGTGFVAGAINAAAGGGSLLSFPALLAVGYPALDANVTNTVALCPGYLGGTFGYRRELAGQRRRVLRLGGAMAVGSVAGAALLAVSSRGLFRAIVPVLVLAACALLAAQPWVTRWLDARGLGPNGGRGDGGDRSRGAERGGGAERGAEPGGAERDGRAERGGAQAVDPNDGGLAMLGLSVLAGAYGAYFGAALGVLLLALLGTLVADSLQRLNALKGVLSLIANWVAAAIFIAFAPVHWAAVAALAPASLLGGRVGVVVARRLPDAVLRSLIVAFGTGVAIYLLVSG
jgi:uncharacterized membrane protein YfcA